MLLALISLMVGCLDTVLKVVGESNYYCGVVVFDSMKVPIYYYLCSRRGRDYLSDRHLKNYGSKAKYVSVFFATFWEKPTVIALLAQQNISSKESSCYQVYSSSLRVHPIML